MCCHGNAGLAEQHRLQQMRQRAGARRTDVGRRRDGGASTPGSRRASSPRPGRRVRRPGPTASRWPASPAGGPSRIVGKLGIEERIDRGDGALGKQQCRTVRRRRLQGADADLSGRTGPVVDQGTLPERRRQLLADGARDEVGNAACRSAAEDVQGVATGGRAAWPVRQRRQRRRRFSPTPAGSAGARARVPRCPNVPCQLLGSASRRQQQLVRTFPARDASEIRRAARASPPRPPQPRRRRGATEDLDDRARRLRMKPR